MQYHRDGTWVVEFLDDLVLQEIRALPADMRARLQRLVEVIEHRGLNLLGYPQVKHLEDKLWEMRLKGRDGISRALYVTASGRRVVVVRVFIKKTEQTPRREILLALKRAKAVAS